MIELQGLSANDVCHSDLLQPMMHDDGDFVIVKLVCVAKLGGVRTDMFFAFF